MVGDVGIAMFQATIKADVLRYAIKILATLVDEVKLHVDKDKIVARAVDKAHVALVEMEIGKGAFVDYKAKSFDIGLDLDRMKDALKLAKGDTEVKLKYEEKKGRLIMNIDRLRREMGLVDLSSIQDPKVPPMSTPVSITIKAQELARGIMAAESFAEVITLKVSDDSFEMVGEGDSDTANLSVPREVLEELECDEEEVKSTFSLEYFASIIKVVESNSNIKLLLGNDYPMKLEFKFADDNGAVSFFLAPRIDQD